MPLAVLKSRALNGIEAPEVRVEVHLASGLPSFTLVGLPDTEVKEARDRVRAAIQNCRFEFPAKRITVNLAPADLPKDSGRFDLPIALGILIASGQIPGTDADGLEFAGELSLSGELRPIRGALAMSLNASKAGRSLVVPEENADEAALAKNGPILPAQSLPDVCAHLAGTAPLSPHTTRTAPSPASPYPDLSEVKGQHQARRALEVAAAGAHSLLMSGPPGTGKSMLAARLAGILPPMSEEEALACAAIQSLVGHFQIADWGRRPLRTPHHSASSVALVGGGGIPRPGEISLAHEGVLFLDELPEFDRRVLEALREPLETGHICISRASRQARFPARFQLVAAMNPCPCGYLGHPNGKCRCTPDQVARYRGRISGPLMDRIDLQIEVPPLPDTAFQQPAQGEISAIVAERVAEARRRQEMRQGVPNARLSPGQTDRLCKPDAKGEALLQQAIARLGLSARAYHRILRVARTIADLAGHETIQAPHLAEAIQYRRGLSD